MLLATGRKTTSMTNLVFVCVLLLTRTEFLNSKFICPSHICSCNSNIVIDCRSYALKDIPKFMASNTSFYKLDFFEDPVYVYTKPNNISSLYAESFKNITVEQIDLRSLRLTNIDSKAFAGVELGLKELYIEGDGRLVVNLPFLKGLMALELLHLENFGITDVTQDNPLKELTSLKTIRLKSCNNVASLGNNTFLNMPNLKRVCLEILPSLQTVPTAIQNIQSLTYLKIYKTSISHLDEDSFKGLTNLQYLDLSKNYLQSIEHTTFTVLHETLQYLDLSLNKLSRSVLSMLTTVKWMNLTSLKLSHNPITNLHEGFFKNMSTLQVMELNQCNLNKILNTTFQGLGNLFALDISINKIVDIEVGSFLPTPNLTHLNLSNQHQVPSCYLLHSSGHPPLNLPHEALEHLRFRLAHLDLGNNVLNLTETYTLIRRLSNLKTLGLKCIGLHDIPSYLFSSHSNLQTLYLDDNNLNKLSPQTLHGLNGSLRELYLNNNKMKTLYKCVLENFTRLEKLQLMKNEWICDCHFLWLYDKILNGSLLKNFLKCTTPESRSLTTLSRNMLVCNDDYFQSDCPIWININITTLSKSSLQITWSVSDKYLLSGYLLEVFNLQNKTNTRIRFHADGKSYVLTEVEPGIPYQICLLIVISETVKENLEMCKTWEIQGTKSSKEGYQEDATSKSMIFKSLIIIGAIAFISIVLAITVILKTVPGKKAAISKQLVLNEQHDSLCTTEDTFSKSGNLHSSQAHFLNQNMFAIYPEPVEHEKLRERCKHLLSPSCENDVQITYSEVFRSKDTHSSNISVTEGPQPRSVIIYTEVEKSPNSSSETLDHNEENINRLFVHTTILPDIKTVYQTTNMYSEIHEPAMDNTITVTGSKTDTSILNKTKSTKREVVHVVASKQRSFNVYTDSPAAKTMEKETKSKVGGLKAWGWKNKSKANLELIEKEAHEKGTGQYIHLNDFDGIHKNNLDAETTHLIGNSNSIIVTGVPKISQKTKLYFKPTNSEKDDNSFY